MLLKFRDVFVERLKDKLKQIENENVTHELENANQMEQIKQFRQESRTISMIGRGIKTIVKNDELGAENCKNEHFDCDSWSQALRCALQEFLQGHSVESIFELLVCSPEAIYWRSAWEELQWNYGIMNENSGDDEDIESMPIHSLHEKYRQAQKICASLAERVQSLITEKHAIKDLETRDKIAGKFNHISPQIVSKVFIYIYIKTLY